MADNDLSRINMSSIHVAGIGGLGMVVVAAVMVYVLPQLRLAALVGVVGGLVVGAALVAYRRRTVSQKPPGPTLMVDAAAEAAREDARRRNDSTLMLVPVPRAK